MARMDRPRSLLERASDMFDLGGTFRGKALPPFDIPAELIPQERPVQARAAAVDVVGATAEFAEPGVSRAPDFTGPVHYLDRAHLAEAGLVVPGSAITALGEEFAIVKRELLARIRGERGMAAVPRGNVILVTSPHAGEGKTFCAVNIALALAAECEVVLADADFAHPGVAPALGLPGERGLMDAILDPAVPADRLAMRTDIPNLAVLPAGASTGNDAEAMNTARISAVIDALVEGRPDRVLIFDSPPLLAASVAAVLAAHAGQTLLVVRADRTTETALRDAAELLRDCGRVELLLNGVKFSTSGRRFGAYYGKAG